MDLLVVDLFKKANRVNPLAEVHLHYPIPSDAIPSINLSTIISDANSKLGVDPLFFLFYIPNKSKLRYYFDSLNGIEATGAVYTGDSADILIMCFISTFVEFLPAINRICGPEYLYLNDEDYAKSFCRLLTSPNPLPDDSLHCYYASKLRTVFKTHINTNFWSRLYHAPRMVFGSFIGGEELALRLTEYAKTRYYTQYPTLHPASHNHTLDQKKRVFNVFNGEVTLLSHPDKKYPSVIPIEFGVRYPNGSTYAILCVNCVIDTSTLRLTQSNTLIFTMPEEHTFSFESFSYKLVLVGENLYVNDFPVFLNNTSIGLLNVPKRFTNLIADKPILDPSYERRPTVNRTNPPRRSSKIVTVPRLFVDGLNKTHRVLSDIEPFTFQIRSTKTNPDDLIGEYFDLPPTSNEQLAQQVAKSEVVVQPGLDTLKPSYYTIYFVTSTNILFYVNIKKYNHAVRSNLTL